MKMTSTFTVSLTLDLDNPLLGSAHCLVTLIICTNLFQNTPIYVELTLLETKFRVVFVVTLTFDLHR